MSERGYTGITGATDGIGRALAERLAGRGEALFVHGRDRLKLDRLREELLARGAAAAESRGATFTSGCPPAPTPPLTTPAFGRNSSRA
ncbi:MAG: hypothetical protein KM296_03795 [Brockia lithotrophica]|nr:hypothetical protein [Brockia lithotrophica]